jgi:hypothetical protein
MKRKLLYTAIVAAVMGSANPAYAQSSIPMYHYYYFEGGQQVGEAEDFCAQDAVISQGIWLWGYRTYDVQVVHVANCVDGQAISV